jgi:hypothetical protein
LLDDFPKVGSPSEFDPGPDQGSNFGIKLVGQMFVLGPLWSKCSNGNASKLGKADHSVSNETPTKTRFLDLGRDRPKAADLFVSVYSLLWGLHCRLNHRH